MRKAFQRAAVAAALTALFSGPALAQIKIAYIDPFSGPFANTGEVQLSHVRQIAETINARGGVLGQRLEILPFDGKSSPQDSASALRAAYDKGVRFVFQGNGSNITAALVDAINKQVSRGDQPMVLINFGGFDPDLTNSKCSFWHFRFMQNVDMSMNAISSQIASRPEVKKVYQINQDYHPGHQAAKAFREMLTKKRPDVQLVGDDLHPLGRVKDFSPYAAKIAASGADTVLTTNWGNDLTLLVKAIKETGSKADIYTLYANTIGVPTVIGKEGIDTVFALSEWHANIENNRTEAYANAFQKKFNTDFILLRVNIPMEMLAKAMTEAGSTDPTAVARKLEGMRYQSDIGEVVLRAEDHQLQQPLYISTFAKVDGKAVRYDLEKTGVGMRTVKRIEAQDAALPSSCQMKRPV